MSRRLYLHFNIWVFPYFVYFFLCIWSVEIVYSDLFHLGTQQDHLNQCNGCIIAPTSSTYKRWLLRAVWPCSKPGHSCPEMFKNVYYLERYSLTKLVVFYFPLLNIIDSNNDCFAHLELDDVCEFGDRCLRTDLYILIQTHKDM